MRVIGVIGQNGSGKDEVLKYLKEKHGVPFLSTGDMVREIAAREGRSSDRATLQEISDRYFRQYGQACFVKMAAEKIRANGWPVTGISGVRSPDDVTALRETLGKSFVLIEVFVSDPRVRFDRMRKRAAARDTDSFERFLQQDQDEERIFHVGEAARMADYSLCNDGRLDDLHRAIEDLIDQKGLLRSE
ncbi:MAG: AAA family ATPase [Dehalococcoidia bacterium]|nr:AAA family ATPase [Dehalococcoidia bacterium]